MARAHPALARARTRGIGQGVAVAATESAVMLDARLGVIERIRRMEHLLARSEQARVAAGMMKGFSHELGNQVQIVKLSALEIARRLGSLPMPAIDGPPLVVSPSASQPSMAAWTTHAGAPIAAGERRPANGHSPAPRLELEELLSDMTSAADAVGGVLAQMFAAARPSDRDMIGPPVANLIRAAVDTVRPAVPSRLELRIDLAETVQSYASAEELEALVLSAILDAGQANHITLMVRERVIQNKRWIELLRFDDRHHMADGELAHMFEPHSLLHVVAAVAKVAGGDASVAPGRAGLELAVELPVAGVSGQSASSS